MFNWSTDSLILITGSTGLLGRHLANTLIEGGFTNLILLNRSDVDLLDFHATCAAIHSAKPDVVFHFGARVHGIMGNLKAKGEMFFENIMINTHVIEGARRAGVKKTIAMGSVAVYGDDLPPPISEDQVWLGKAHHSEDSYGEAKRAMLVQLQAYKEQYGMSYAFCVSTNLYGPYDRFDDAAGHVIPSLLIRFIRAKQRNDPKVTVWGTGAAKRDFLFAEDAARALILIAATYDGVINLASGQTESIFNLVEIIRQKVGYSGDVVWDRTKPEGQLSRSYDTSKLYALGFKRCYSLERGIEMTIDWLNSTTESIRT